MIKEEVYSFILYYMRRIESSNESQFSKLNKILILRIYYNIFEYKYDKFFERNIYSKDKALNFINNFNVDIDNEQYDEDREIEDDVIDKKGEFLKVEEKITYTKEFTNETKEINTKKEEADTEKQECNPKESYEKEELLMEENKEIKIRTDEDKLYKHVMNDIKVVLAVKSEVKGFTKKELIDKEKIIKKHINNNELLQKKIMKVPAKIAEVTIREMIYGKVRFPKGTLEIIDINSKVMIQNLKVVKSLKEDDKENANLIYSGVIRISIGYLEEYNIYGKDVEAQSKYYLTHIPFEGIKNIEIEDEDFKKEKFLGDKISFDIKSSEFANDTVLKEERCIGTYAKVYDECEAFIILECVIDILMKKIIENI